MFARIATLALFLFVLNITSAIGEVIADRISTISGRLAEQVTEVGRETDGKLRIVHSGGIWRINQSELTEESQIALGLEPQDSELKAAAELETLETLDGRRFEGIRRCIVSPSDIRFLHSTGATTIRFKDLPDLVRKRFGYDESKANAYERQSALAKERADEELLVRLLSIAPSSESRRPTIFVDLGPPSAGRRLIKEVSRAEARSLTSYFPGPWVWVAGYYRDDGTYVPGHYRTQPDSALANNWSTEGNRNPVTGEQGTVDSTDSTGYSSGRVQVKGYRRKDGTYVRPHSRRK